jgi:threonine/homoserine/homoserine lactone efflux protein
VIGEGVVMTIAAVLAGVFSLFVGFTVLFTVLDLVVVLLLALLGIVARLLLRRPRKVETAEAGGRPMEWRVVGGAAAAN